MSSNFSFELVVFSEVNESITSQNNCCFSSVSYYFGLVRIYFECKTLKRFLKSLMIFLSKISKMFCDQFINFYLNFSCLKCALEDSEKLFVNVPFNSSLPDILYRCVVKLDEDLLTIFK